MIFLLIFLSEKPHNDDTSMVKLRTKLDEIEQKRNEIMTSENFAKWRKYLNVQLKRVNLKMLHG